MAVSVCAAARDAKQSGCTEHSASNGGLLLWAIMQVEHRLNLARQIEKMATRIERRFLATSDPLLSINLRYYILMAVGSGYCQNNVI